MLLVCLLVASASTQSLFAAELGSIRLRAGPELDLGDIEGGAVAATLESDWTPALFELLGDDIHYEAAVSFWDEAASDRGPVWTGHIGPVWRYRPDMLGAGGFVELGTSVAYVSERRLRDRDLGSRGHFTSHLALGRHIGRRRRWHAAIRVRHTSNAGLGPPNPGLDIVMLELAYHWARRE